MNDKLREAALLLRGKNTIANRYDNAGNMLAKAYLAEHPADDDEQVRGNLDRLVSMGFTLHKDEGMETDWSYYVSPEATKGGPICTVEFEPLKGCDGWTIAEPQIGSSVIDFVQIPEMQTFGDVRRLCKALGIELKASEPS